MRRFEIPPPSSSRPIETDDIPPHSRSSNKRPIKGRQLFPETSTRQNESWCEFAGLWQCRLGSAFVDLMSLDPSTTLADFIQAAFLRQSVFGSGDIAEAAVEARD
jgi:hypothetical protein